MSRQPVNLRGSTQITPLSQDSSRRHLHSRSHRLC